MINKKYYFIVFLSVLFSIIPFFIVFKNNNFSYPKIPVEIADDSLFYFARSVDVYKGNYFIGNPYSFEHRGDVSANFFVSDWLWSVPLFLGLSLNQSIIFNQVFWFIIFGILVYSIFRNFRLNENFSIVGVIFSFSSLYWYISRPVSMQIVYPFFLLFLFLLHSYFVNFENKKIYFILGIYAGLSLYLYTYLAQFMALVFIVIFIASWLKNFKEWRTIFYSGLISFILALPYIFYSFKQLTSIYYKETLYRLGMLNTHFLGGAGFYYLSICLAIFILVYIFKESFTKSDYYYLETVTLVLAFMVVSNVFTGIDFELAVHVGKFVDLWSIIVFFIFLPKLYVYYR